MLTFGENNMNEVTLSITTPKSASERFLSAWETGLSQGAHIGFESEEQLWEILTLKRWKILKAMTGRGEITVVDLTRQLGFDISSVQADIKILLNCGLVDKTDNGKIIFPYDAVHVDFMLQAA
jgi:predicted transcriptional regulator